MAREKIANGFLDAGIIRCQGQSFFDASADQREVFCVNRAVIQGKGVPGRRHQTEPIPGLLTGGTQGGGDDGLRFFAVLIG